MDLLEIRDKIDSVDKELVKLFEERMDLCKDVANYKIENQKQVLDPIREKEKIAAIEEFARSGIVVGTKAPEVCPVCNHPQSYFEVHEENY